MGNNIKIKKEDENRAKIEKVFEENIFFDEVYKAANDLVADIIKRSNGAAKEAKECHQRNYQGYGNNMIIFSGDRGQGKTSAMISYANFLKAWPKNKDETKDFLTQEQKDIFDRKQFQVLKAIDPSALSDCENIIHILLIRLFHEVDEYLKSSHSACGATVAQINREEKQQLVKLFEYCYNNLSYIKNGKKEDMIQDNLETLAQYGNSIKLKENLYKLIDLYLRIKGKKSCCGESGFLVIPIDDADLSTNNVFEICEDIHNYLTLPNIIILQAINFDQLRRTIYQRYLQQYRDMCTLQKKEDIADKCYHMATKYLEKMMPYNHHIELPYIKFSADDNVNPGVKIFYQVSEGKETSESREYNLNGDIVRALYKRTGLVLPNRNAKLHPFMPHTMREMTSFLNIIDNMEEVNFKVIFSDFYAFTKTPEKANEIRKWEKNLQKIKLYFLQYWCANRLDPMQMELLKKLDEHTGENEKKIRVAVDLMRTYIKRLDGSATFNHAKASTYHSFLHAVEIHETLQKDKDLQEALHLYFSIFLNEWFATACTSKKELKQFIQFVDTPFYYSDNYLNATYNGYKVTHFETSNDQFSSDEADELLNASTAYRINAFCKNDNTNETVIVEIKEDAVLGTVTVNPYEWNDENEKFTFDLIRPFMFILQDEIWSNIIADMQIDSDEQKKDEISYFIYVKTVLTNYELQKNIGEKVDDLCRKLNNRKSDIRSWKYICDAIYTCLDYDMSMFADKLATRISKLLLEFYDFNNDSTVIENIFLGNELNGILYADEWNKSINKHVEVIREFNNKIIDNVANMEGLADYYKEEGAKLKISNKPKIISGYATKYKKKMHQFEKTNADYLVFWSSLKSKVVNVDSESDNKKKTVMMSEIKSEVFEFCQTMEEKLKILLPEGETKKKETSGEDTEIGTQKAESTKASVEEAKSVKADNQEADSSENK